MHLAKGDVTESVAGDGDQLTPQAVQLTQSHRLSRSHVHIRTAALLQVRALYAWHVANVVGDDCAMHSAVSCQCTDTLVVHLVVLLRWAEGAKLSQLVFQELELLPACQVHTRCRCRVHAFGHQGLVVAELPQAVYGEGHT